jgi:hypothetical protein
MLTTIRGWWLVALMATSLTLAGCNGDDAKTDDADAGAATSATDDSEAAAIEEALAKLSPEDRALAEKQKICPVGDSQLGSMGPPVKVKVGDRDVFICCAGCEEELKSKPEEYLAKIPE